MKKGTLATIMFGIIAITLLIPASSALAGLGDGFEYPGVVNKLTSSCDCPAAPGCYCSPWVLGPYPCFPDDVLEALRGSSGYIGEDEDRMYFEANITDLQNNTYTNSESGSYSMSITKEVILQWVSAGCPRSD